MTGLRHCLNPQSMTMIAASPSWPSSGSSRITNPSSSNWRFLGLEVSDPFPFVLVLNRLEGCPSTMLSSSGARRFVAFTGEESGVIGSFTLTFFGGCGSGCGNTNGGESSG